MFIIGLVLVFITALAFEVKIITMLTAVIIYVALFAFFANKLNGR
jgi:hypothetical protein